MPVKLARRYIKRLERPQNTLKRPFARFEAETAAYANSVNITQIANSGQNQGRRRLFWSGKRKGKNCTLHYNLCNYEKGEYNIRGFKKG